MKHWWLFLRGSIGAICLSMSALLFCAQPEAPIDQLNVDVLMRFLAGLKKDEQEQLSGAQNKTSSSDADYNDKTRQLPTDQKRQAITDDDKTHQFYEEYLAKYYPKALVIRSDFFTNKSPQQVAGALRDFIELLVAEPWFYVANKPEGFKLVYYWEFIMDQCALINAYLKRASVNLEDNVVSVSSCSPYSYSYMLPGGNIQKKTMRLLDYLKKKHNDAMGIFYAFSFDYAIKLFNEGILLKSFSKAARYFTDLEFIMEKLQGTAYEAEYQELMTIARQLYALLKQKRGLEDTELFDQLYGDDENAKKVAQESMLLNKQY